jgi:hypothetical protein
MIAENPIRVFAHSDELARLSIAVLICACAWPPIGTKAKSAAFDLVMAAFIGEIERVNSVRVFHPHRRSYVMAVWRPAWRKIRPEKGDKLIQLTGHRLMMRRFAALELRLRMMLRPEGKGVKETMEGFALILAARAEQAEFYRRTSAITDSTAKNIDRDIWRESRPVLHLAHALQEAFFAADVSPWDWPALACAPDPQARLRRLVAEAESARRIFQGGGAGFSIRPAEQLRIELHPPR